MNYVKWFVAAVGSLLSSVLGILYVPVLLMVLRNVVDYTTGLWAAGSRQDGGISSYRSMRGIIKKVTMWLLVLVGTILDQLLLYASVVIRYQLPFTFFCGMLCSHLDHMQ